MFRLEITTENAAFDDDKNGEVARILHALAERIDSSARDDEGPLPVRDINGNTVGRWELT